MMAWGIRQFGGPEVIEFLDLLVPTPGDLDLLIEVHAVGMNPVDTKIRRTGIGLLKTFPVIMGYDVSGVVRAVGSAVKGFREGEGVYCFPGLTRPGANAEFICVDSRTVAHRPDKLTHVESAGIPLALLTAWECLYDRCNVQAGENVLIQAGAGGVGHFAIQLAKLRGCRVIATAGSDESIALCRGLGADVVINHRTQDVAAEVRKATDGKLCPVVLNTLDDRTIDSSVDSLAVDGRLTVLVLVEKPGVLARLRLKNATLHMEVVFAPTLYGVRLESHGRILADSAKLFDSGKLKVHVSRVFPLPELAEAHRLQETGHVVGKLVLKVKG